jgi:HD-GYP domain-containing protein (c-di-GMP phosphodiesterase class II)
LSIALGTATKEQSQQDIERVLKEAEDRMYRHKLLESRSIRSSIISSLEKTLFEKSFETEEHAHRLLNASMKIGREMGLTDSELDDLGLLAVLHDLGKIAISDKILIKPGRLTPEEWHEMKKHPETGYRIAESSPELSHVSEYVLSHHERWDGTGYPQGLKGSEIPKLSRIISIVDAFDAMTHPRPYKKAVSVSESLAEIERCSGTQFDPEIVDIFINLSTAASKHSV